MIKIIEVHESASFSKRELILSLSRMIAQKMAHPIYTCNTVLGLTLISASGRELF